MTVLTATYRNRRGDEVTVADGYTAGTSQCPGRELPDTRRTRPHRPRTRTKAVLCHRAAETDEGQYYCTDCGQLIGLVIDDLVINPGSPIGWITLKPYIIEEDPY